MDPKVGNPITIGIADDGSDANLFVSEPPSPPPAAPLMPPSMFQRRPPPADKARTITAYSNVDVNTLVKTPSVNSTVNITLSGKKEGEEAAGPADGLPLRERLSVPLSCCQCSASLAWTVRSSRL
jgi:hypothetical protein